MVTCALPECDVEFDPNHDRRHAYCCGTHRRRAKERRLRGRLAANGLTSRRTPRKEKDQSHVAEVD
jgi:hypothetical protein